MKHLKAILSKRPLPCSPLDEGTSLHKRTTLLPEVLQAVGQLEGIKCIYRVFQKEYYNFGRSYKFIQRACAVISTVIMLQKMQSFTWDSYGSMCLPLVMQDV
jgi:hypothetical protein